MADRKDAKLVVRLPRPLLDAAKEKARTEDITVSQYVRRCLMKWVGILPAMDETHKEGTLENK
jgi:predicted DNA binding CopG/RHH family protein